MARTITDYDVEMIVDSGATIVAELRKAVRTYGPEIKQELRAIDEARAFDPDYHAQRCFLIAITSPQTAFDKNVRAAKRIHEHLFEVFNTSDDVQDVLEGWGDDGYMGSTSQGRYILQSLQYVRALTGKECNWDSLWYARKAQRSIGVASKTIAFASALYNARARVFTLDRWMLRGLLAHTGIEVTQGEEITISPARYKTLQAFCLDCHDAANVGKRPFVSQWALWNLYRGDTFQSHVIAFT